jgi:hypothetical protein
MKQMDKRAWLRQRGFDVGNRGRFSAEMLEALKEFDNGGGDATPVASLDKIIAKSSSVVMRDATAYMALTNDNLTIACGMCSECHEFVMYCQCVNGPVPPKHLTDDIVEWYPVYHR